MENLKLIVALGFAIIFGATGDILLSVGMQKTGEVSIRKIADIPPLVRMVFGSPFVLLGVLSMALYFSSYIAALAWIDVSVANPLTALSYLIASVYAIVFLRERVNIQRGAGIALVIIGAVFVGLSS